MSPAVGWALAGAALVVGWLAWGWQGLVLGVTVVVFWLLLQFSRTLRLLRAASLRPVGAIDSAVMLHTRVHTGMRLLEVLPLTRSLGRRGSPAGQEPEVWIWADPAGHELRVTLTRGRVSAVALHRAEVAPATAAAAAPAEGGTAAAAPAPEPRIDDPVR